MIRMAEASAKLHLREFVRSDDIDLAIQVTINSFIQAQKISVKRQLERGFRKYLRFTNDHFELLGFVLGQIVKEKIRFHLGKLRGLQRQSDPISPPEKVTIKVSELEERAKEVEIYDVGPFLKSQLFKTNGYHFNHQDREPVIIKHFGSNTSDAPPVNGTSLPTDTSGHT